MLVLSKANLVFLAVPKTGTTAIEMALRPKADIALMKHRKHVTAQKYRNRIAPWLSEAFGIDPEPFAVIREPIEQLRSWYRYRSGARVAGTKNSTEGCSFDEFVQEAIRPDPPAFADVGRQWTFLTGPEGELLVTHLFAYENQPVLRAFLETRLGGEIRFKQKNVSPPAAAPLSAEIEARLRAARAEDFALYDKVAAAGGHLVTRP